MTTAAERVTREDLVMFINACFACTGQREFYADATGQQVSIEFLHDYILGNYRLLYARALAAGINHFSQATAIVRLLSTGRDVASAHRAEEGALIAATLRALPTHQAYHVLSTLAARRVNNRRARAVVRDYLASRRDPAFEAVKYRRALRAAAVHAHLRFTPPDETGAFLFRALRERRFETPLFESFRQAHFADGALYDLPFTIAEGLAVRRGVPREVFLQRIAPRLTAGERLRLQGTSERVLGERFAIDLAAAPPTRLASYVLSLPREERMSRRDELHAALDRAAHRAAARTGARFGRVAAVLDASYSSSGSSEKRRRPLAVALAASAFLRAASREYRAFWSSKVTDEILVEARGATDLATPILDAIAWGADVIAIVSDGYENDPPHGASEVLRVWRARLARPGGPSIVHLNPVFDADGYAPRALSPAVPTVGLRDAEDIPTMIGFARFAAGEASLDDLETYLAGRVARLLHVQAS
ncbi:Hypothetical protein A7982_05456 [Minicystis rosea]|nr:Hypothetical protein A7982_05456 [Minicystis rosea]